MPRPTIEGLELLRPAWVQVDLDRLLRNLDRLEKTVGQAQIAAVVKADAYGHGAVEIAAALANSGQVDLLAVAIPEEGAQLRRAGIEMPILVLGAHLPSQIPVFADFELMPTISNTTQLAAWCDRESTTAQGVHLKVDTGMRRLGFALDDLPDVLERLRGSRHLELAGVLSHFAASNEPEARSNRMQQKGWEAVEELLTEQEKDHAVRHIANSAAALHLPSSRLDMVRVGLALYGVDPADRSHDLEAVMSVKARIIDVRDVAAGDGVGYSHRWRAPSDSRVGLLPLGYADGYAWRLGNCAQALSSGGPVDVIGNVSMDMTAIDLTHSKAVEGDEVTLLGTEGEHTVSAFDLAQWAGTIPYETLVSFGLRLPRITIRGGRTGTVSGRLNLGV